MRVCVLGAGAMGSAIGGLLADAGAEVVLLDRWREQVDAVNSGGLILHEGSAQRTIRVRATTEPDSVGAVDLVIVLVKSYDTRQAVQQARAAIGSSAPVLSLQNGLGNEDALSEILGPERVLGGVTHAGGVLLRPGEVRFSGREKTTYIGEMNGELSVRLERIVRLFNAAGLNTEGTAHILEAIWSKLLVNVAVSALSAVTRLAHGGMGQVPEVKQCALEAVREAVCVARTCGIRLSASAEDPAEVWETATRGLPPQHKSSMLKDIEKGAPTEIDAIAGAVVQYGKRCGVPTPVNGTLLACVRGIEFAQRG